MQKTYEPAYRLKLLGEIVTHLTGFGKPNVGVVHPSAPLLALQCSATVSAPPLALQWQCSSLCTEEGVDESHAACLQRGACILTMLLKAGAHYGLYHP